MREILVFTLRFYFLFLSRAEEIQEEENILILNKDNIDGNYTIMPKFSSKNYFCYIKKSKV